MKRTVTGASPGPGGDLHAIAQHVKGSPVRLIELQPVHPGGALQLGDGFGDDLRVIPALGQPGAEQIRFDIGVAGALVPVAQVPPSEAARSARGLAAHLGDHTVLRGAFRLADGHL
ncbi:MAG: hypothetical protein KJ731_20465 [Alphaproteobacteria bacterium]|nr:hypothetical protein [Alphaproteobacteria bacterium]MBU1830825.1 hypothetical protein [Alphaproteobacteria bacterium]